MKTILKIIFAPIMLVLWLFIKLASLITLVSGMALGVLSDVAVIVSLVYLFKGSVSNAIIGIILAFLLSPYGIPLLIIKTLGAVQRFKYKLQYGIYG